MEISTNLLIAILASTAGFGLLVNLVAQLLKKTFGMKADGYIHTMVLCLSGVASAAQYIIGLKTKLPPEILGVTSTSIYGFSQFVFKYAQIGSKFASDVSATYQAGKQSQTTTTPAATTPAPSEQTTNEFAV